MEEVNRYSKGKSVLHKWSFLTGSEEELAPVWRAYYVAAAQERVGAGPNALEKMSREVAAQALIGDTVTHDMEVELRGVIRHRFT